MIYPEDFVNKIICGDCIEVMKDIPDNTIDMVLTSPPYDNLRDYHGYNFNFEGIAKELHRVIADGGVIVWVVGDATIDGSETGTSFRQALHFKEIGFKLHDTMIYKKDERYPSNNRYNQCFEYMFIFIKNNIKTFNKIRDREGNRNSKLKLCTNRQQDNTLQKVYIKLSKSILRNNIWYYSAGYMKTSKDKIAFDHPAIFPELLAHDHIISWSNPNDIILDPMCGSGTTCKRAKMLNRRYIGIDISEKYCEIARQRIVDVSPLFDSIEKSAELIEQKLF